MPINVIASGSSSPSDKTAKWEHIKDNQKDNYGVVEISLDSSQDSTIIEEHVTLEDNLMADAPALPSAEKFKKTPQITYGAQDIQYKKDQTEAK